jgi:hypothetical protein
MYVRVSTRFGGRPKPTPENPACEPVGLERDLVPEFAGNLTVAGVAVINFACNANPASVNHAADIRA